MMLVQINRKSVVMVVLAVLGAFATGCASGGYKLTRQYAGFVNKQNIIVRILLYIFTSIVFGITMLVDLVVFNTVDFWNGTVSKGNYNFEKDGRRYAVNHDFTSDGLKKSQIIITDKSSNEVLQTVQISETAQKDIEIYVDGKLTGKVADISSIPMVTTFNSSGMILESKPVFSTVDWIIAGR